MNVAPLLFALRRHKDVDELEMMKYATNANRAVYARAHEIVRPGPTEVTAFNHLQQAAVEFLGEPLTYFWQEFSSGTLGGPPRNRGMVHGEFCILDSGIGFHGYFCDDSRTYPVDDEPMPKQIKAWQQVRQVFELIEDRVRPGAKCEVIYKEVHKFLNCNSPWVFDHHSGHGLGLAPHEAASISVLGRHGSKRRRFRRGTGSLPFRIEGGPATGANLSRHSVWRRTIERLADRSLSSSNFFLRMLGVHFRSR